MAPDIAIPAFPGPASERGPLGADVHRLRRWMARMVCERDIPTLAEMEMFLALLDDLAERAEALEWFQGLHRREAKIVRLRPRLLVVEGAA